MRLPGKVTYFILLSLGSSATAFIFHIAALVTQFWRMTSHQGKEYIRDGLWKKCFKLDGIKGYVCGDIKEEEINVLFRAVQCSVLLGLLFILMGAVATAGALILAREKKGHTKLLRFAVVVDHLALIAIIVTIVAYGVFTNKYIKDTKKDADKMVVFGFSYVLEILTGGLKLLAGLMAEIHIRFKDEVDHLTYQPEDEETMEQEESPKKQHDPHPKDLAKSDHTKKREQQSKSNHTTKLEQQFKSDQQYKSDNATRRDQQFKSDNATKREEQYKSDQHDNPGQQNKSDPPISAEQQLLSELQNKRNKFKQSKGQTLEEIEICRL